MNGEETTPNGKAFAHFVDGAEGKAMSSQFAWENSVANPHTGDKTVVAGTDDATPGQLYFYFGDKQATGSALDKAGLTYGTLYGLKVTEWDTVTDNNNELNGTTLGGDYKSAVSLVELGDVSELTGPDLQTKSENSSVTEFLTARRMASETTIGP